MPMPTDFEVQSRMEGLLKDLSPRLRKAIYAASKTGNLATGTWNGCVMNKAVEVETGSNQCDSVTKVNNVFGDDPKYIQEFIVYWDNLSVFYIGEGKANEILRNAISAVGFDKTSRILKRVVTNKYHNKKLAALNEEFISIMGEVESNLPVEDLSAEAQEVINDVQLLVGAF